MDGRSYYEFLGIAPSATTAEIQEACDLLYSKWLPLASHHEYQRAAQANTALHQLDTIRVILSDPAKREAYDAGVGLTGQISGLADPSAILPPPTSPFPPPPPQAARGERSVPSIDTWACPRCGKVNPVATRFCSQCGQVLGTDCPKCGRLVRAGDRFCPNCGANIAEVIATRAEAELLRAQQEAENRRRQALLEPMNRLASTADSLTSWGMQGCLFFLFWPAGLFMAMDGRRKARQVLNSTSMPGDEAIREKATKASERAKVWLTIYRVEIGLIVLIGVFYLVLMLITMANQ